MSLFTKFHIFFFCFVQPLNPPSKQYHSVIVRGIVESHNLTNDEAIKCLKSYVEESMSIK
jgi:hypothetical protein